MKSLNNFQRSNLICSIVEEGKLSLINFASGLV